MWKPKISLSHYNIWHVGVLRPKISHPKGGATLFDKDTKSDVLMFAAPNKTFKRIIQKKSAEDFKGIPYITALLSTSLWTFYGLLKPGGLLVVIVNGTSAILHIVYVTLFLIYAPKILKNQSLKLVAIIDIAFLGAVIEITLLAVHGNTQLTLVGLLAAGLNIVMYASLLSAVRTVIKMKSVEYMPFFLSFFQFLNGGVWAAYEVLVKDYYIGQWDFCDSEGAFDKLKSGLLCCEARLRKALDEERSLRHLCYVKEVELVHLQYKKNMEALEHLRDEVGRARHEHDELKARAEAQDLEGNDALAKVPDFEAQLRIARDNALV
ncbi:bidirectional sugar transporter SWEET17-like [Nicotiana tabacum]|uniref:Bidirectional sugar transporter SWEET17-like n=1 Tax=Nicotiana tabacum TaxID=4097 RepID=A0AC58RY42_TOBAC